MGDVCVSFEDVFYMMMRLLTEEEESEVYKEWVIMDYCLKYGSWEVCDLV